MVSVFPYPGRFMVCLGNIVNTLISCITVSLNKLSLNVGKCLSEPICLTLYKSVTCITLLDCYTDKLGMYIVGLVVIQKLMADKLKL